MQPWMPQHRNRDLRGWKGEREALHPITKPGGVPFGNRGDQVGAARKCERAREAADDRGDLPLQTERLQCVVDGAALETCARNENVPACCIPRRSDLAAGQRMSRLVDRIGEYRVTIYGLVAMASAALILPAVPASFGVAGYVLPLVVLTAGYALFQAANNTAVMVHVPSEQRGVISGLLNLSRNVGLITGASVMGAVFATAARATDIASARPEAIADGMRMTFGVAAGLIVAAWCIAYRSRVIVPRK